MCIWSLPHAAHWQTSRQSRIHRANQVSMRSRWGIPNSTIVCDAVRTWDSSGTTCIPRVHQIMDFRNENCQHLMYVIHEMLECSHALSIRGQHVLAL